MVITGVFLICLIVLLKHVIELLSISGSFSKQNHHELDSCCRRCRKKYTMLAHDGRWFLRNIKASLNLESLSTWGQNDCCSFTFKCKSRKETRPEESLALYQLGDVTTVWSSNLSITAHNRNLQRLIGKKKNGLLNNSRNMEVFYQRSETGHLWFLIWSNCTASRAVIHQLYNHDGK